jgi:hypothetical protein
VPIDTLLAGLFIALVAVLVVGAQFITAEYRRGLIRATLASSPGAAGPWPPRPSSSVPSPSPPGWPVRRPRS